jgi:hypothetical protein
MSVQAVQAATTFTFTVRINDSGKQGSFTKKVDAASSVVAWTVVVKELKASGLLKDVIGLTINT